MKSFIHLNRHWTAAPFPQVVRNLLGPEFSSVSHLFMLLGWEGERNQQAGGGEGFTVRLVLLCLMAEEAAVGTDRWLQEIKGVESASCINRGSLPVWVKILPCGFQM